MHPDKNSIQHVYLHHNHCDSGQKRNMIKTHFHWKMQSRSLTAKIRVVD